MSDRREPRPGRQPRPPWWLATKEERAFFYAGVSALFNAVFAAAKLLLFLLEPNLFLLANVLFSLGVGAAKAIAVGSYRRSRRSATDRAPSIAEQYRASTLIGAVLTGSAIVYIALCLPLLIETKVGFAFEPLIAEILALIAFIELGFAITGTIRTRHSKQPLVKSIRIVNLGSGLILLVLAQAAILSFASTADSSWGVGISAMLFGGSTVLCGLYLVIGSIVRGRATGDR
ncbi:hypothetical protein [Agromyces sp. Marseille-Q5079]|uniref:hypothetical protein n=1 Tax=Agromyces sp. Marseille-Q5079 TaxID=3439059 RepID=UPI003D9CACA4